MENREFIINLERATLTKLSDDTISFNCMLTINDRTQPMTGEMKRLEKVLNINNGVMIFSKEIIILVNSVVKEEGE